MSNLTNAIAQQDAAAVEVAAPRTPVALLQSDTALQMIAESLPAHMDAKTFQRHAITPEDHAVVFTLGASSKTLTVRLYAAAAASPR